MRAPTYVWKRGSSFFFQYAVPADLIPVLGRTPLRSRLPVTRAVEAIRVARVLAIALEMTLMGKFDALGKNGGIPAPDRKSITAEIDREIRELHDALLNVESGPNAPDRRTRQGELEYQRLRADALAAALRAMTSRSLGLAADWERDVRRANSKIANYHEENLDLQVFVQELGGDVSQHRKALKSKDAALTEQITKQANDDTLSKVVIEFVGKNAELVEENKRITKRLEYRGPLFSEALPRFEAHMTMCGVSQKEINNLSSKAGAFINIVGDKEIASYTLNDLQKFAADLCYLPAGYSVNPFWKAYRTNVSEIIRLIRSGDEAPRSQFLTEKTIATGYIGRVKQALRFLCATHEVPFPYEAYGRVRIPAQSESVIRHGLDSDAVNRLIRSVAQMACPDSAFVPIVALLTGARIGELVYLKVGDLIQSDGVWIFNLTVNDDLTKKRRLKSANARRFITVHHKLEEMGFISWAREQKGEYIFQSFHKAAAPHNAASKRFQRLFRTWSLDRRYSEVFHALRHTYKDLARGAGIEERTLALQTGHSLQGVALSYGTKATRTDERQKLAALPLPETWDFSPLDGIEERVRVRRPRRKTVKAHDGTRPTSQNRDELDALGLR